VNSASDVRKLGVEEVVVLEVGIGVAIRARGAGGWRLQANELAAPVKDEIAPGKNGRMTPHAADPLAEHAKGLLGRLVIAIHVRYRTIASDERENVIEFSR